MSRNGWYIAPALQVLLGEVNAMWPARDKKSDGGIGDTAHSFRESDHNPNARGSVNARDFDRDGIDPARLVSVAIQDARVNYVIFDRQIYRRKNAFRAERYTGSNPHTGHVHVSLLQSRTAENNTSAWGLRPSVSPLPRPKPSSSGIQRVTSPRPYPRVVVDGRLGRATLDRLRMQLAIQPTGSSAWGHWDIRALKVWLNQPDDGIGIIDRKTAMLLQYRVGLRGKQQDGIVGKQTLTALQQFLNLHR